MDHFTLSRPVPSGAAGISPDWSYFYGATQHGVLAVHHGDDFVNTIGTPVLAVADGQVIVAGDDSQPRCGANGKVICGYSTNFYGNLIVLRLDATYQGQPVFILYGHLDTVEVQVGRHVQRGDRIATVGESGIAKGPHVHLEVRLGVNDYAHTRNPGLWLKPLGGRGVLAGRVALNGSAVRGVAVTLYSGDDDSFIQDTDTYDLDDDNTPMVVSDGTFHENFSMMDVPAGTFVVGVNINGVRYSKQIQVSAGAMTFVTLP